MARLLIFTFDRSPVRNVKRNRNGGKTQDKRSFDELKRKCEATCLWMCTINVNV